MAAQNYGSGELVAVVFDVLPSDIPASETGNIQTGEVVGLQVPGREKLVMKAGVAAIEVTLRLSQGVATGIHADMLAQTVGHESNCHSLVYSGLGYTFQRRIFSRALTPNAADKPVELDDPDDDLENSVGYSFRDVSGMYSHSMIGLRVCRLVLHRRDYAKPVYIEPLSEAIKQFRYPDYVPGLSRLCGPSPTARSTRS